MIRVLHLFPCRTDFNLLCDRVHQEGMLKRVKKWSFFSIFSHLGTFSQLFGQDTE